MLSICGGNMTPLGFGRVSIGPPGSQTAFPGQDGYRNEKPPGAWRYLMLRVAGCL